MVIISLLPIPGHLVARGYAGREIFLLGEFEKEIVRRTSRDLAETG